jgi:hypothetical protein
MRGRGFAIVERLAKQCKASGRTLTSIFRLPKLICKGPSGAHPVRFGDGMWTILTRMVTRPVLWC